MIERRAFCCSLLFINIGNDWPSLFYSFKNSGVWRFLDLMLRLLLLLRCSLSSASLLSISRLSSASPLRITLFSSASLLRITRLSSASLPASWSSLLAGLSGLSAPPPPKQFEFPFIFAFPIYFVFIFIFVFPFYFAFAFRFVSVCPPTLEILLTLCLKILRIYLHLLLRLPAHQPWSFSPC